MSWDAASDSGSGVDHYDVFVDGAQVQQVASGTTSATVSNLSAETSYDIAVTATDGASNESAAAGPITVSTDSSSGSSGTSFSGPSGEGWSATVEKTGTDAYEWSFEPANQAAWADVQFADPGSDGWVGYRMDDADGDNVHLHTRDTSGDGSSIDCRFVYEDGSGGSYISERRTMTF